MKREGTRWDSDSLGGRKASARISTFLGALAPFGAERQICNKEVSIKELFIILWAIMHFSHEECGCRTVFCVVLQVQGVRKSGPKYGDVFKLGVRISLFGYVEKEVLPF